MCRLINLHLIEGNILIVQSELTNCISILAYTRIAVTEAKVSIYTVAIIHRYTVTSRYILPWLCI